MATIDAAEAVTEQLLAFPRKCHAFCASCRARRTEEWAFWLQVHLDDPLDTHSWMPRGGGTLGFWSGMPLENLYRDQEGVVECRGA